MEGLTPRQQQFVMNYAVQGMSAGRAYALAYHRSVDNTAYVEGYRLLRNPKIHAELDNVRLLALQGIQDVLDSNKKIMDDSTLPAIVRFKATQEILYGKLFHFLRKDIVVRETCSKCKQQDIRLR